MKTVTVFTPQDIEKMILEKMNVHKYEKLTAVVSAETVGYGTNEHEEMVFKGYRLEY